jgi:hypothetical protein
MSRSMIQTLILTIALALPMTARADVLAWDLFADCPQGAGEVKLKMSYSIANYWVSDPLSESQVLYACGGACEGPHELATPITWRETGTSCWCMMTGKEVPTADDCPPGDYAKCSAIVEATLPYSCDELAYNTICTSPSCKPEGEMMYGPAAVCAELKPRAGADQCLAPVAPILRFQVLEIENNSNNSNISDNSCTHTGCLPTDSVDEGGCSISTGAANASLLTLLLVAAGLSLLLSRRRGR